MTTYNHLVCIAFSLRTSSPTVENATPDNIIDSLQRRVDELKQDICLYNDPHTMHEYIEDLGDSYVEDE